MARLRVLVLALVAVSACSPDPSPRPTGTAAATTASASAAASPGITPTPVPMSPASGRIAFIRTQAIDGVARTDVYAVDADGSDLAPLTDDELIEVGLFWLRDGSRLVILWERTGNPYRQFLSSVRPDGSDRVEIGQVQLYHPSRPSPDGRYVAFGGDGVEDQEPPTGVVLLDLGTGADRQLSTNGETDPRWSPDGTRILAILPSRRVEVIDVATGEITGRIDGELFELLGWSEDGTRIRYAGCPPAEPVCSEMVAYEADADGSDQRPFEPEDPSVLPGFLSPDGTRLATVADDCTVTAVEVASVERLPASEWDLVLGACEEVLGSRSWSPVVAWSADSQWFVRALNDDLVVQSIAGTEPAPLTDGASDVWPAWQP